MKAVTGFFKNVASKASGVVNGAGSLKGRRAFNAFHSGDYEGMVRLCATMTPK